MLRTWTSCLCQPSRAARPTAGPIWLGLLILYVVWGSTYLGIAVAVETIPPFLMAAVRFAIAGTVLMAWSLLRARGSFVAPSRREWRDTIIVGTLLLGGGMGMVAFGEQTIPSGIAALLIAMMPVWVAIFGRIFLGERLPRIAGGRDRRRLRRRRDPRRADDPGPDRCPRPARPGRHHHLADRLVARLALRLAPRDAAPPAARRDRHPDARRRRGPRADGRRDRRVRAVRPRRRLGRFDRRPSST